MTNAPGSPRDHDAAKDEQFSVPIPGLGGPAQAAPTTAIEVPDRTRVMPVERPAAPPPPISSSPYSQQPSNPYASRAPQARPTGQQPYPSGAPAGAPAFPAPRLPAPAPAPMLPAPTPSPAPTGERSLAYGFGAALIWMAVGFWVVVGVRMARYLVDRGYDATILYNTLTVDEAAVAAGLAALGAVVLLATRSGRRGLGWFALLVAGATVAVAVWRYLP